MKQLAKDYSNTLGLLAILLGLAIFKDEEMSELSKLVAFVVVGWSYYRDSLARIKRKILRDALSKHGFCGWRWVSDANLFQCGGGEEEAQEYNRRALEEPNMVHFYEYLKNVSLLRWTSKGWEIKHIDSDGEGEWESVGIQGKALLASLDLILDELV